MQKEWKDKLLHNPTQKVSSTPLENKDLFQVYLKLGMSHAAADYKTAFFRNSFYSAAKLWFTEGCKESPQKMGEIIKREYEN